MSCVFCDIAQGRLEAPIVFEDDRSIAFLDHRPLFAGHLLLIPKNQIESLADLPASDNGTFLAAVELLSVAVEAAMNAQGTFIAINNKVSQSVPHLHVHIVPRRKGDGLRGFFWPRGKYNSAEEMREIQSRLHQEVLRRSGAEVRQKA